MSTKIWTFSHEPKTFDEMILNENVKPKLKNALKEIPNLMLVGPPGVGKGTFTNIFLKETKLDFIKLNCSDETSVDTIRSKVKSFATSMGSTPLKVVVLNESDYLTPNAQAMLRDLIESVQSITRFIFQCNYGHKMIKEIVSRCRVIELNNPPPREIYSHCEKILKAEGIQVKNPKAIVKLIKDVYPDIRRTLQVLHMNVIDGVLDTVRMDDVSELHEHIFQSIITKDLDGLRGQLRGAAINYTELYEMLYNRVGDFKSPGDAILMIGEHMYRDSIVAIKEINFVTMIVDMMKRGII